MSEEPNTEQNETQTQDDAEFDESAELARAFMLDALLRKSLEKKQAAQQEGNTNG